MTFSEVSIDDVRSYWNQRPCNIRHSDEALGSPRYSQEVEHRKYFVEPHIPEFADFYAWKDKEVLEIGCGIGTDTINFARAGAHVTAIDLSSESLLLAEERLQNLGLSGRVELISGNAERLHDYLGPLQQFDLIYSFGVLHHTPHPERAYDQIPMYLAPGGVLKLMVYNRISTKVIGITRGIPWNVDEKVAMRSEAQTGCPVTYTYTPRQITRVLKESRLRVTDVQIDHIFPYRVKDYVEGRYVRRLQYQLLPHPIFRALERTLGWHLLVTAVKD